MNIWNGKERSVAMQILIIIIATILSGICGYKAAEADGTKRIIYLALASLIFSINAYIQLKCFCSGL